MNDVAEQRELRDQEVAEERQSLRERIGSRALAPLLGAVRQQITARAVREYIRAEMAESAVKRVFDIGMGVETFDVPTMAGNTVNVPASPSVQVKALLGLVSVGVPTQLGLIDDDGNTLPGVIALGELDMRSAQAEAMGSRFAGIGRVLGSTEVSGASEAEPVNLPPMTDRVAAGEFELVEVDEGIGASALAAQPDAAPPPIDTSAMTPEQVILARRRARKANGNGK